MTKPLPESREDSRPGPSGFDPARIPHGPYCYASLDPMDERGHMAINGMCPYWERTGVEAAFCHYLKKSDDILLWDQVKICGVNDGDPHPSTIVGGDDE